MRLILTVSGTEEELSPVETAISDQLLLHGIDAEQYRLRLDRREGIAPFKRQVEGGEVAEEGKTSEEGKTKNRRKGSKGKGKGGKGKAGDAVKAPVVKPEAVAAEALTKKQKRKGKKGKGKGGNEVIKSAGKNNKAKGAGGEERYTGIVQKFNSKRNYYYVKCEALEAHFQCDVVLQKEDLPKGAVVGSEVSFVAMEAEGVRNPIAQKAAMA